MLIHLNVMIVKIKLERFFFNNFRNQKTIIAWENLISRHNLRSEFSFLSRNSLSCFSLPLMRKILISLLLEQINFCDANRKKNVLQATNKAKASFRTKFQLPLKKKHWRQHEKEKKETRLMKGSKERSSKG